MIGYFGEPERDIRDVLIAELTKQRDELLAALKFQFSLSIGLLHAHTDEELPEEIKQQALNIIDDLPTDISVLAGIERSAEAIASVTNGQPEKQPENESAKESKMIYYLVLMNRETVVAIYSYDNEEAQLEMFDVLNRREYYMRTDPFYTHVQVHNEVN